MLFKSNPAKAYTAECGYRAGSDLGLHRALVGAKLLYLATVLPNFLHDLPLLRQAPRDFLAHYLLGGFVFYGGLFGALLAAFLYCRTSRISFSAVLTQLLPVIPLIHAFGRIGCFCSGCCYGRPSQRFGIAFSHALAAPNGVKLLPVQLYEAATTLGLLFCLPCCAVGGPLGDRCWPSISCSMALAGLCWSFSGATATGAL